jgi:molecular chaperone DnaJ
MSKRDYYEVLGVDRRADEQAIRSAFRKKAGEYHPDRHPNAAPEEKKKMEERFKELGEAYDTLSDANKRARYDQFGHAASGAGNGGGQRGRRGQGSPFEGFGDFGDMFGDIMGDMFGQRGSAGAAPRQGADLRVEVSLTFDEAAFGKEVEVEFTALHECAACDGSGARRGSKPSPCARCSGQGRVRVSQGFFSVVTACPDCDGRGEIIKDACPECRGQGRVRAKRKVKVAIPAGVDNGIQIRKRGEGESGTFGGPAGDLYVSVTVKAHPIFTRDGVHVLCELPLSFTQAALGVEAEVPTLEGRLKLKIPAGTQNGKVFRMKGKGVASLDGRGRGDQLVSVFVETPSHLNAAQKALLEEFSKISGEASTPRRQNFLDKIKEFFT